MHWQSSAVVFAAESKTACCTLSPWMSMDKSTNCEKKHLVMMYFNILLCMSLKIINIGAPAGSVG